MPPLYKMSLSQVNLAVASAKALDPTTHGVRRVDEVFAERTRAPRKMTVHGEEYLIGDSNRCSHCGQRHGSEDEARNLHSQIQAMNADIQRLQAQASARSVQDEVLAKEEEFKLSRGRTIILED